ncbi:MAG: ATP-binding cassette domain-containing protein [Pseudomonadota bacterium]|nr:ATP-binding cassette domain-containing protein [Pseudomonadota bacterium]
MIETSDLSVKIGETTILNAVNASFPTGVVTALVGPNGAGKSTLLAAVGRLLPWERGEVLLDGAPVADMGHREFALKTAILRQDQHIAPRLRVRDLVTFGRFPHTWGRPGREDERIVDEAMARLELETLSSRFLDTLSGGQRQRARIAMALAQATDVLLLDEPLNALDVNHARGVMHIAKEEAAKGRTVVLVLHDLSVAAVHADHIVALRNGNLFAQGPVRQMISTDMLSRLYEAPIDVIEYDGRRIVLTH